MHIIPLSELIARLEALKQSGGSDQWVAINRDISGNAALISIRGNVVDICNPILSSTLMVTRSVPVTAEEMLSCTSI